MSTFTGTIPTIASGDTTTVPTNLAVYRDALKAISEAWTSYTPTWSTTGTAPALVNGTLAGAWARVEKLVIFRIRFAAGSSTTFGTGAWLFSLPTAAHSDYVQWTHVGNGMAFDTSGSAVNPLTAYASTTSTVGVITTGNSGVTNTVPWTWASGDRLSISGVYETA